MKNRGFTLVELLGGIVILSIITLITIPVITNTINKSRLQTLKNSAYGLLDATNLYYAQYGSNENIRFDIENNKVSSSDTNKLISYKGNIKNGTLILNQKGKTTLCITDGKNSVYKNYNENEIKLVEKQTCFIPENNTIVYLSNDGATRDDLSNQELTDEITSLKNEMTSLKLQMETIGTIANSSTIDKIYPIGSIYISTTDNTVKKVEERFGGTWVEYGDGKVLKSSTNISEVTGGSNSIELKETNLPSHTHVIPSLSGATIATQISSAMNGDGAFAMISEGDGYQAYALGKIFSHDASITINLPALSLTTVASSTTACNNCNGTAFSIENEYITVYMYKRTS